MSVTDKELDKLRSDNDKLRDQIAAEEAKRVSRDADMAREIEAEQLAAEHARLEAQLNLAKAASAAKSGNPQLQVARDAREAAEKQGKEQVDSLKAREEEAKNQQKLADEQAAAPAETPADSEGSEE